MDIREKMKLDWDRRAKVDPLYWVAATQEADEASYHESAARDAQSLLLRLGDDAQPEFRVLDLGCGIGRMTAPLADHFSQVVGIDVSSEMIERAREMHSEKENLSFEVNSGADLAAFENHSFDLVFSYSVLPHLPPEIVESYFAEVNRVLKPGGLFVYQFWVGPERRMAANDTLNIRVYSPEDFQKLNKNAGLSVESMGDIDYFDPVLQLKPVWVNARRTAEALNEESLNIACTSTPSDDETQLEYNLLLYLADKHHERGESDEAERVIEEAIRLAPDEPSGYVQWAVVRVERGDVKGALTLFETLTDTAPDFVPGWIFRANCEESMGRKADALKSLKQLDGKEIPEHFNELIAELKASLA